MGPQDVPGGWRQWSSGMVSLDGNPPSGGPLGQEPGEVCALRVAALPWKPLHPASLPLMGQSLLVLVPGASLMTAQILPAQVHHPHSTPPPLWNSAIPHALITWPLYYFLPSLFVSAKKTKTEW